MLPSDMAALDPARVRASSTARRAHLARAIMAPLGIPR